MSGRFVNVLYKLIDDFNMEVVWVFDDKPEEFSVNRITGVSDSFYQLGIRNHIVNNKGDTFIMEYLLEDEYDLWFS